MGYNAQVIELNYKTKCIGFYILDFPDNIEVSIYPTNQYFKPKRVSLSIFKTVNRLFYLPLIIMIIIYLLHQRGVIMNE
jgi:hypothetical protein